MKLSLDRYELRITNYALRITFYVLLAVTFALISFTGASAQSVPPTDDEVNAIAHKLYCPVCESTPLDVCPTDACKDWREQIRVMLTEGKSEEEILKYFELQYGARVLAEPPKKGFYWFVYLLPPVIILAGAIILFRSMKEWTAKTESVETGKASAAQDDYLARMEEELKKQK
jgi:cytochrome c-type biogenesis protein CcmH